MTLLAAFLFFSPSPAQAVMEWDLSGAWKINFAVDGGGYDTNLYDLTLTQSSGSLTGLGQYPSPGPYAYAWTVIGSITGNTFTLTDTYTLGAVGTIMTMSGVVASDGTLSGTWSDNYGGGRTGIWKSTSGVAIGTLVCATIEGGTITDTKGNPITTGFDKWGYNYQAHLFNGFADNFSRPTTLVNLGDKLVMKWSDSWLANVDCDGDHKLDRGLVDGQLTDGISKGWLTNNYTGLNKDGKRYTDFMKIVWVGPEKGDLWGEYTIIQEVWNDKSLGIHGLFSKLGSPGFGLNNQWTMIP